MTIKSRENLTPCERAEESIRKKFHKSIFTPFAKGIKQYELLKEGDMVAV